MQSPNPLKLVRRVIGWFTVRLPRPGHQWLYSDRVVKLDEHALVIRSYYWPFGSKRIVYAAIKGFERRPLKAWQGQFRVQGLDLQRRWYSRDRHRGEKESAIDLDLGKLFRPVLTPEDPDLMLRILEQRMSAAAPGEKAGSATR